LHGRKSNPAQSAFKNTPTPESTGFAGLNGCTAGVFWYSAEKQEKILPISGVGCTLRFMAEMLYFSCKSAVRQKK
jgi:hypothetical protein